jgi:phosphoribosylamine--glycine ligase
MLAAASGTLAQAPRMTLDAVTTLTVVLAAAGYPASPKLGGGVVVPCRKDKNSCVFIAGVGATGEGWIASGGRVLAITGTGYSLREARDTAYKRLADIEYDDGYFRRDIGWRELRRQES